MLDLEPIKERLRNVPGGKWEDIPWEIVGIDMWGETEQILSFIERDEPKDIRIFFTHARTDISVLIAEVEEWRDKFNALRSVLQCGSEED